MNEESEHVDDGELDEDRFEIPSEKNKGVGGESAVGDPFIGESNVSPEASPVVDTDNGSSFTGDLRIS